MKRVNLFDGYVLYSNMFYIFPVWVKDYVLGVNVVRKLTSNRSHFVTAIKVSLL